MLHRVVSLHKHAKSSPQTPQCSVQRNISLYVTSWHVSPGGGGGDGGVFCRVGIYYFSYRELTIQSKGHTDCTHTHVNCIMLFRNYRRCKRGLYSKKMPLISKWFHFRGWSQAGIPLRRAGDTREQFDIVINISSILVSVAWAW